MVQYENMRAVKIILLVAGVVLLLYSIIFLLMFPKNQGAYFLAFIGAVILLYTSGKDKILEKSRRGLLKFVRLTATAGFCLMLVTFIAFCVSVQVSSNHTVDEDRDALIVLGAGLRGETVSITLAERLNAAASYYFENPNVVIVVSGGQGKDEPVSEAFAMQQYLISKGVGEGSILIENKSTSTAENFSFSKDLLDGYFGGVYYTNAYVTNAFHCRRAGKYAEMAGLDADFIPAGTPALMLPAYCAREYLGNLYVAVFRQ